jgi:hypothetical protein
MAEFQKRAGAFFISWRQRPLVLAPYLIVLLFAANESAQLYIHFELAFWPTLGNILLLLTAAFIIHFSICLIIPQRFLAGILAAYVLAISLFYFDLYSIIYLKIPWVAEHITRAYNLFLLGIFGILGFLLWLILRPLKEKLKHVNNYLLTILSLFIVIEIGKALLFEPFNLEYTNLPTKTQLKPGADSLAHPDVYYIIFDSYTSSHSLEKYWDYNNPLDTLLQQQGFYVASNSRSNYNGTNYSIASCLNMSYANVKTFEEDRRVPESDLMRLPSYSLLADYLNQSGYQVKAFSLFDFMGTKKFYQIDTSPTMFFRRTLFFLLQVKLGLKQLSPFFVEKRKNLEVLDSLIAQTKMKTAQPKFVYAHIYLPHPPFFYDENGNEMADSYAFGDMAPEKYLQQLKYVNSLISSTIKQMLLSCQENSIIIVQGDHGFRFLKEGQPGAGPEEGSSIFNAYYFPDQDYRMLYDSISPVNSFRVILNKNFGTQLPLLPDTSYYLQEEKGFQNLGL